MKDETIEVLLQGVGEPKIVRAAMSEALRDVLARENALPGEGQFVFVGEAIESVEVDGEDAHEPVTIDATLEALAIYGNTRIHTRVPRHIEVVVFYNGEKKRRFPPSATVARVLKWAKHAFDIDPSAGSDLILKLKPSGKIPRMEQHLSDLLGSGEHRHPELCFELVREVNPQG